MSGNYSPRGVADIYGTADDPPDLWDPVDGYRNPTVDPRHGSRSRKLKRRRQTKARRKSKARRKTRRKMKRRRTHKTKRKSRRTRKRKY